LKIAALSGQILVMRQRTAVIFAAALVAIGSLVPTPAGAQSCQGDCDGGGSVAINELIVLVNIALGSAPVSACTVGDANDDGSVTINELIGAVGIALNGCPAPAADATAAALAVARALAQLPGLTDIIGGALDSVGQSQTCGLGGTLDSTCEDAGAGMLAATTTADHCRLPAVDGFLESTGAVQISAGGECPDHILPSNVRMVFAVDAVLQSIQGAPLIAARIDATITVVSLTFDQPPCEIRAGAITIDGPITYRGPGGREAALQFDNTGVTLQFTGPPEACEDIIVATVDGPVRIDDTYGNGSSNLAATLHGLAITAHGDAHTLEIEGEVESSCVGGTARLHTAEPLAYPLDQPCFAGGMLDVTLAGATTHAAIGAAGGVDVDRTGDGVPEVSYASCLDLPRNACE
jgi:hypothetical protein